MALFSVSAETMLPTALVLNILVASLTIRRFVRARQFNAELLVPFVIGAIPAAYIAGHGREDRVRMPQRSTCRPDYER